MKKGREREQNKKREEMQRCERAEEIRGDGIKTGENPSRREEEAAKQGVKKKENKSQYRAKELIRVSKVISQSELSAHFSFNHVSVNELMSGKQTKCTL